VSSGMGRLGIVLGGSIWNRNRLLKSKLPVRVRGFVFQKGFTGCVESMPQPLSCEETRRERL
jgi:hypothetical protein